MNPARESALKPVGKPDAGNPHVRFDERSPRPAADSAVIREVAVADLLKLTQILQPPSPPEMVARVEGLIQATVAAIHEDRREWAVGRFIEAVTTDPSRAEELRSNPDIQPIRNTVDQRLVRLKNVAKMDAETKLAAAERVIEDAGWQWHQQSRSELG